MQRRILMLAPVLAIAVGLSACATSEPAATDPEQGDTDTTVAAPDGGTAGTADVADPATDEQATASPTEEDMAAASIPLCADPAFRDHGASMAFIFASLPVGGALVAPGFPVAGCANVNEGNVQWRLLDSRGNVMADGFTQASCGTGCVGDFAFNVNFAMPDGIPPTGTLEVFSSSEKDGSQLHLNSIPLAFTDQLSAAAGVPGSKSACDDPAFSEVGASMAFIFTSEPAAATVVRPGFIVSGCANVNEGNVQWRLVDAAGGELASGFTQAECGTGCVGGFGFTVDYASPADAPAPATLQLYSTSMESGAEEFLNNISLIAE